MWNLNTYPMGRLFSSCIHAFLVRLMGETHLSDRRLDSDGSRLSWHACQGPVGIDPSLGKLSESLNAAMWDPILLANKLHAFCLHA